ncbi:hypothetical protein [Methylomonas sp. MK1]|uniref:hypothetical protein n=1 Tax=Methylomonas sp. MK1 TaxID=1131552 RepID=UPI000378BA16|nr:hypothetical protein [Methylomonas sp. MK1]
MEIDQHDQPTSEQPPYTGPAVAASLSVLLAFFTLMVSHHISRLSPGLDKMVHSFGYWIPGSQGSGPDGSIGSYTGKETLALTVWFGSWLLFHLLWRKQNLSLNTWTKVFIVALGLITLGFFHPLSDPIVLFISDLF